MKTPVLFRAIAAIALLIAAACGTRAELMVGDKAPRLQTGKWIQGRPVRSFDSHHVYIVEFWATWCGPCVASIPHLNALWQQFQDKGVIVIGQDVWDSDAAVAPFVKKMGTNMTYRVALDDKRHNADGYMADHWWKRGTNYHGIPCAFIINRDGIIAWIGHPMTLTEQVLDDIVSGHYDVAKAATDYREELDKDKKFQELQNTLFSAVHSKNWGDAGSALDRINQMYPRYKGFTSLRLKVLLGQKKWDQAYQFADSFSAANETNAFWQNELAWDIAISDGADAHCLGLAERMAQRGVQLTKRKNPAMLDTLARVQFMLGEKDKAVATEAEAADTDSNPDEKAALEKTLASYRDGKLPSAE